VKKAEVRDLLYAGLGEVLTPAGFQLRKAEEAFARQRAGVLHRVYVPLWDYNPVFQFSLTAGIRIDAVEEIFHRCSGAPAPYQKLSSTTLTQLPFFGGPAQIEVTAPDQVSAATAQLAPVITGKILPYFGRYSDVAALDGALNGGAEPGVDTTQLPSRALHWVAIAYLADNADVEQIAARFAAEMDGFPETERAKLDCLLAELARRRSS
jgi:hypothetical protein